MTIIQIEKQANGSHNNQTTSGTIPVPDGWAILPDNMETPNFPFGDITVDKQTPPVVTSWTPGEVPEPEEPVEPETEPDVWDELDAAYQEGVNSVD